MFKLFKKKSEIEKYWKNGRKTEDLIKMIKSIKQNKDEKKYDKYDLINFHKFAQEHKETDRIGNGLLMWEEWIEKYEQLKPKQR